MPLTLAKQHCSNTNVAHSAAGGEVGGGLGVAVGLPQLLEADRGVLRGPLGLLPVPVQGPLPPDQDGPPPPRETGACVGSDPSD